MADSPITTPEQAQQILDLTNSQFNTIRAYFGINDFPYQTDKTYIIFDADSGNNNLHIDTGTSKTYSILKGDGTIVTSYTDTGGTKVLNYANAGRYIITIEGTFNGLLVSADKAKYISIVGGSNYPTTVAASAFNACSNLENAIFLTATTISSSSFKFCTSLVNVLIPSISTLGESVFEGCTSLISINLYGLTTIDISLFKDCTSLVDVILKSVTTIGNTSFDGCISLVSISLINVTTTGLGSFDNCDSLINVSAPNLVTIGDSFDNCISLDNISLPSITTIGSVTGFASCASLQVIKINYTAGLSVGTNAFNAVNLTDLYVIGAANLTEAQSVETKLITAGMTQLANYRLLY